MLKKNLLLSSLLLTAVYAENNTTISNLDANNSLQAPQVDDKKYYGHIFDFVRANLSYGYSYSSLNISNDIKDSDRKDSDGKSLVLADGGKYAFKSIQSKFKRLVVNISDYEFAYSIRGTNVTLTSAPWDLPKYDTIKNPNQVYYLASEFLGGYLPLRHPNALLGYESLFSLIYRKATFQGYFKRGELFNKLKINKNQYGISYNEATPLALTYYLPMYLSALFDKTEMHGSYKFLYERSVLPQVIYFQNGYEDMDEHFTSNKYVISSSNDNIYNDIFIFGNELGIGYASTTPGLAAQKRIRDADLESQVDYSNAIILYAGFKVGLQYTYAFKYTAFSANILYSMQYLSESSSEVTSDENDNGKMELIYDRTEVFKNLKLNLNWTF